MKLSKNKLLSAKIKGTLKMVFGIPFSLLFALFFAVYLDITYTDGEDYLVAAIVCVVGFVLCIWMTARGIAQKRLVRACERYAAILARSSVTSIEQLSGALGQSSWKVRKNLDRMLHLGYLENIYFDHAKDAAVVQTPDEYLSYQPSIIVECQACGGKSKVAVGQSGVCEYCGSPIYGEWASAEE